jgi:hypothetical protein
MRPEKQTTKESPATAGPDNLTAYIPFGYLRDFIDFLADNPDLFQILTYDDLMWQNEPAVNGAYPGERKAWDRAMREGRLDPDKIYILIQHDVDSRPELTFNLLKHEAARGIRSNIMIFNRLLDRKKLAAGELEYLPYKLDFDFLRKLREQGFVVGYHANAYEQSRYDTRRALEIFRQDIEELRRQFPIRYFSAHGGVPGPGGLNNADLPLPGEMLDGLIWVHNPVTPYFRLGYSDGGINSVRDLTQLDLRNFVRQWRPGNRYRVLIHPQYYHTTCKPGSRLRGTQWYEEVWAAYHGGQAHNIWADVESNSAGWYDIFRTHAGRWTRRANRVLNFRRRR